MRRPVGIKWVLLYFRWTCLFFGRVAADAILPSALSRSDVVRSVQVGRSRFSRCCHLIVDLSSVSRQKWARRLTQSPELGFRLLIFLSQSCFCFYAAIASGLLRLLCSGSYASPLTHR